MPGELATGESYFGKPIIFFALNIWDKEKHAKTDRRASVTKSPGTL